MNITMLKNRISNLKAVIAACTASGVAEEVYAPQKEELSKLEEALKKSATTEVDILTAYLQNAYLNFPNLKRFVSERLASISERIAEDDEDTKKKFRALQSIWNAVLASVDNIISTAVNNGFDTSFVEAVNSKKNAQEQSESNEEAQPIS